VAKLDESFMQSSSKKLWKRLYSGPQVRLEVSSIDELGEASGEARRLAQSGGEPHIQRSWWESFQRS